MAPVMRGRRGSGKPPRRIEDQAIQGPVIANVRVGL
jgi:hypothetical protein